MIGATQRMRCALVAVGLLFAAGAAEAHAQAASCTYDACAMRVRAATFTQPPMLVRGMNDQEVAPLTPFGETVAQHFARTDSAYTHALRYDRLTPVAAVLNIAGTGLLILGPLLTDWRDRPVASFTLLAGGVGMTMYGAHLNNVATEALNRALWWHNRF